MRYQEQLQSNEDSLKILRDHAKKNYLKSKKHRSVYKYRNKNTWGDAFLGNTVAEAGVAKHKAEFEIFDKAYWRTVGEGLGNIPSGKIFDIYVTYHVLSALTKRVHDPTLLKLIKQRRSLCRATLTSQYFSNSYHQLSYAKQEAKKLQKAGYKYQVNITADSNISISLLPPSATTSILV